MNKNGQIGKIVTSFPVMILIFVVIILYLISSGIARTALLKEGIGIASSGVEIEPFLAKVISVKVEEVLSEVIVFDAFVLYKRGKVEREDLEKALLDKLNEKHSLNINGKFIPNCFVLVSGRDDSFIALEEFKDFFLEENEGGYSSVSKTYVVKSAIKKYDNYRGIGLVQETDVKIPEKEEALNIRYYFGRCL